LGLGAWLIVGGLPFAAWSRWRLRRTPGVFACRLHPTASPEASIWSHRKQYARWVNGVLLVHRGPTLARCEALGVANLRGPIHGGPAYGRGERPVRLRLHLDDGRQYDLLARQADIQLAIGPFVVASLS
jgi:hypothetical protein